MSMDEEKDVLGWEHTNAAPKSDAPSGDDPKTRIDEKPKLGSDERARLASGKRT